MKLTPVIPLVGYLIVFNDAIADKFTFLSLTNGAGTLILDSSSRLQFVYFGLFFLAISNAWYLSRRPLTTRQAIGSGKYVEFGLGNFTVLDFVDLFGAVTASKTGSLTRYWDFGQNDLDKFIVDAEGNQVTFADGQNIKLNKAHRSRINSRNLAIDKNSEFVRSLLLENYAQTNRSRKFEQISLRSILAVGYLLLAIPSAELFLVVLRVSIF